MGGIRSRAVEILKALFGLGKELVGIAVVIAMAGVAVLVTGFKLGLITGAFFLLVGSAFVLVCSAWLGYQGKPGMAKLFALGATITIAGIIISHKLPGTTQGAKTIAAYQDHKNLERAQRQTVEVLQSFRCDRGNADTLTFFGKNGIDGTPVPLLYYDYDTSGRIICFRNPGINPRNRNEVREVTPDIVEAIAAQESPQALALAPPPPAPVVARAAVPEDDEPTWSPPTRPGRSQ